MPDLVTELNSTKLLFAHLPV